MAYTTIQISQQTRRKLSLLKNSQRETYDELLNKLLSMVPTGDDEGEYTDQFRAELLSAKLDLKYGRVVEFEKVKKMAGL